MTGPALDSEVTEKEVYRRLLKAVLNCDIETDENGHAYLKVPARSVEDLGAKIRYVLESDTTEP